MSEDLQSILDFGDYCDSVWLPRHHDYGSFDVEELDSEEEVKSPTAEPAAETCPPLPATGSPPQPVPISPKTPTRKTEGTTAVEASAIMARGMGLNGSSAGSSSSAVLAAANAGEPLPEVYMVLMMRFRIPL